MTGWIKIWRSLLDWEWADVPEILATSEAILFGWLL